MKKIMSFVLAFCCLFALSTNTLAAEESLPNDYVDTLTGISTRSLEHPTRKWNFDEGNYNANIEELGSKWLFTNYYFTGEDSLTVDYDMECMPMYEFHVGCYDLTSGKWHEDEHIVTMRAQSPDFAGRTTGVCGFGDLNTTHRYAIAFKVYNKSGTSGFMAIEGSAEIVPW